ncbi:MAG TPA: GH116 family glycosyl hydrolase, partial [Flavisolibacter sp.]|nr:GH116 family glycosyl hydrolase [Flavisolibacter sp.]
RMRLNGWRGAYAADVLGWHDRAKAHFNGYAKSQLTSPLSAPVISDTALHLARQEERLGTSMFSSGYICRNPGGDFRPHHYDMNLVFVDQLLNHFTWTGDKAYVKQMWPVLKRHLDWEKRNFDADGDGLYDAYACIWASDALQYSGGGVTHSSAYNYKAFAMAAQLAPLAGDDPAPYKKEAEKILNAINKELWMKKNGSYAEYKDLMGLKRIHPAAAIWTIYHAIDSRVPDPFQAYQTLRYVDKSIPHIPVKAKGLQDGYYLLATSNWQPYTWSINNVALAENLHTALAYWQGGRSKAAFHLWKSSIVESMYVSSSPGGFQQLSFYDALRGELYRDFADPVAMAARTLVEGLFGIWPNGLKDTLNIQPGFPFEWKHASLKTPDINFSFRADDNKERYSIIPAFSKRMNLKLLVRARKDDVQSVSVNGKAVAWKVAKDAIEMPLLEIAAKAADKYLIEIVWKGSSLQQPDEEKEVISGSDLSVAFSKATVLNIFDPQQLVSNKN